MKQFAKIFSVVLVLTLLFSLAGCSSFGKIRIRLAGVQNKYHITAVRRNAVFNRDFFKSCQKAMCAESFNKANGHFLVLNNGME